MVVLLCVLIGWLLGGFVSGVSGFGAMMLALPILSVGLSPADAILTCCMVAAPTCFQLAWLYRRHVYWPDMKWLWIGCIPGCVLGTYALTVVSVAWLQIGISLMIMLFICAQIFSAHATWRCPESRTALFITGLASGFSGASVSIVGVPIGIFVLLIHWDKDRARGTMSMFFLLATWITVLSQAVAGLYTLEIVRFSLTGILACVIGQELGYLAGRRINQTVFVRFALCFLSCASLVLMYRGVHGLMD